MPAFRRYRILLLVAALVVGTFYYLANRPSWTRTNLDSFDSIRQGLVQDITKDAPAHAPVVPPPDTPPTIEHQPEIVKASTPPPPPPPQALPTAPTSKPADASPTPLQSSSTTTSSALTSTTVRQNLPLTTTGEELLPKPNEFEEEFANQGPGRLELNKPLKDGRKPVWKKPDVNFPLPNDQLILLPAGRKEKLPKIQAKFDSESSAAKKDRMGKLNAVKESFKRAWNGYKEFGMPHDEVKPISKTHANPFNGWGATLVDSLDTLWIMDLKDEFAAAVTEVEKIDFKSSLRKDIPLFETVIRYLGGLVAAYDLSGTKYPVLLQKAEELAEVLMGAFDTPNRMPITFYNWSPSYASQPHRASAHSVMSELGSLSLEFTRLAQITKKSEYYDAIARITDEMEKMQPNTLIPGLWPIKIDASGCKKSDHSIIEDSAHDVNEDMPLPYLVGTTNTGGENVAVPAPHKFVGPADRKRSDDMIEKRGAAVVGAARPPQRAPPPQPQVAPLKEMDHEILQVDCEPQGLTAEPHAHSQKFALGGQADSTYEYFPKMHQLLGGRLEQYYNMYASSTKAIREKMLFRPMIPDSTRELRFAAKYELAPNAKNAKMREIVTYEVTHLSCFLGGMFALGSKLFGLTQDMVTAEQLTDGCVWAYESMPTEIMAESAAVVPCEQMSTCSWNETRWHELLDPQLQERLDAVDAWNENQKAIYEESQRQASKQVAAEDTGPLETGTFGSENVPPPPRKRDAEAEQPSPTRDTPTEDGSIEGETTPMHFIPKAALSHKKYVQARIQEERLPPAYTHFFERKYILRPEAIESVFYMYRITGDESWRQKGWKMFEAIQSATQTEIGNAALSDVTSLVAGQVDNMESFWLAETLKYFYLLYSDPSVISLDEYVLNTEAHPFKLPK